MRCNYVCNLNYNDGFSLIEVLVAMLILAVGLLGIASLQFKSLQYSNDAAIRSNITILINDITDRMRLNRENATDYEITNYSVPTTRPSSCINISGSNAANDLNCWQQSFWIDTDSSHIPIGTTVSINNIGGTLDLYSVTFNWTDRSGDIHNIDYAFLP